MSDNLHDKEEELLSLLGECCTPYGDERICCLAASSIILSQYGFYCLTLADRSTGIEKKICYIKSTAFIAAVTSRSYLLHDEPLRRVLLTLLGKVHKAMLRDVGREDKAFMIMKTVDTLKKWLIKLRDAQTDEIKTIASIKEDLSSKEEIQLQKRKIERVKALLEKATKSYKTVMYYIAGRVQNILGDPPCKYSIVGLGSLAKNEVTLYSEFTYIIVLEEGVQDRETYKNIREYFLWFATIFQVIVVGLEETPLTLIGVDSLSWYQDVYTPCGIAIDELLPMFCNMARTDPDTYYATILIQPVSGMVGLSSMYSYEKNDIDLSDFLQHWCHVYGSEDVFKVFSNSVKEKLRSQFCQLSTASIISSCNMNQMLRLSPFIKMRNPLVCEEYIFYLSISHCLSYIAAAFGWKYHSGFEIISALKNCSSDLSEICGGSLKYHRIELALAVACELRIKMYSFGRGSRLKRVLPSIFSLTEKRSLQIMLHEIWNLSRNLKVIRQYAVNESKTELRSPRLHVDLGNPSEKSLQSQLKYLEECTRLIECDKAYILHNCLHTVVNIFRAYIEGKRHDHASLERAKSYILRLPGYIEDVTATSLLIKITIEQKYFSQALNICERYFQVSQVRDPAKVWKIRKLQMPALTFSRKCDEMFSYCEKALEKFKDPVSQFAFNFLTIVFGDEEGKRESVYRILEYIENEMGKALDLLDVLEFLSSLFYFQYCNKWFPDAIRTVEAFSEMGKTNLDIVYKSDFPVMFSDLPARCYIEVAGTITNSCEALKMLTNVLEICVILDFTNDCRQCYINALRLLLDKNKFERTKKVMNLIDRYLEAAP